MPAYEAWWLVRRNHCICMRLFRCNDLGSACIAWWHQRNLGRMPPSWNRLSLSLQLQSACMLRGGLWPLLLVMVPHIFGRPPLPTTPQPPDNFDTDEMPRWMPYRFYHACMRPLVEASRDTRKYSIFSGNSDNYY